MIAHDAYQRLLRVEAAARAAHDACWAALADLDPWTFPDGTPDTLYAGDAILLEDAWHALGTLAATLDRPPGAPGSPRRDEG